MTIDELQEALQRAEDQIEYLVALNEGLLAIVRKYVPADTRV